MILACPTSCDLDCDSASWALPFVMLWRLTIGSASFHSRNCQTLGAAPAQPGGLPPLTLVPLNLFADSIVQLLELGPSGRLYIGLVSGLAVARAVLEMMFRTLNAFFAQMWLNLITVLQAVLELAVAGAMLALGYQMGGGVHGPRCGGGGGRPPECR